MNAIGGLLRDGLSTKILDGASPVLLELINFVNILFQKVKAQMYQM